MTTTGLYEQIKNDCGYLKLDRASISCALAATPFTVSPRSQPLAPSSPTPAAAPRFRKLLRCIAHSSPSNSACPGRA